MNPPMKLFSKSLSTVSTAHEPPHEAFLKSLSTVSTAHEPLAQSAQVSQAKARSERFPIKESYFGVPKLPKFSACGGLQVRPISQPLS